MKSFALKSSIFVLGTFLVSMILSGMFHPRSPLDQADIIYYNGDVITLEQQGVVQAIAIKGDTILAIGSNDDMLNLQGSATAVIDLQGRTLLPGFVEGHSHMIGTNARGDLSLDEASDVAFSFGWTTVNELRMNSSERLGEIEQAEQSGQLRIRVNAFVNYNRARLEADGTNEVVEEYWQIHPPVLASDRLFRIIGIKIFLDGAFVNNPARGCWGVTEPYTEEFQQGDYFRDFCMGEEYGSIYLTQEKLNEVLAEAQQAGFQVAMHAHGDSAIGMALDAIENALDGASNELYRHQIHHSSFLRPDQITRYQELDVIASIRGTFSTCRHENQPFIFGQDRFEFVVNKFALPTLIEHAFAEGDFGWQYDPYTVFTRNNPMNPLQNLWGFVTRKDIDEDGSFCEPPEWVAQHEITVEQGLRLLTIGPAYAARQEDVLGTLKAGKFADIVILDRNPLLVDPDEILDLSVLMTMVGGNVEFCKEGNEGLCPETPTTSVRPMDSSIPDSYALQQNYPNPFNPATQISYSLSKATDVELAIYNVLGEKVRILVYEFQSMGQKSTVWNGLDDNGVHVTSGIYFIQLNVGSFRATKKMILMR